MQVFNFNAGPAMLPVEVMKRAQQEFLDYKGTGCGIFEHSHRASSFQGVLDTTNANIREVYGVPENYDIVYIQGGASMQFAMIPMNLMNTGAADFVDTGTWSSKAIKEAKLFGEARVAAQSKDDKYTYIPKFEDWKLTDDASYVHITSNNTIYGTQYASFPKTKNPLIADMSSDIMSRPVNVADFGMIYAGAQKNLGPSGVTLVVMKKALAERTAANVPTMLRYSTYIEEGSMFNTPPTYSIYMLALVTDWIKAQGGIAGVEEVNNAKAAKLYGFLDDSSFFKSPVAVADRSRMNVVFRTPSEELDAKFIAEAKANGLTELKGHRLVGGCRASIYNAMPLEGVEALIKFMKEFEVANR